MRARGIAYRQTALLGALLFAHAVAAQVPREALPSFKAGQVFDGFGIDNVNVYSGDVQLTVPIGPEYSLGAGVTWRLTANYSNHLWNLYSYSCGTPQAPCFHTPVIQHGVLAGRSTLGAGWSLNVGYITGKVNPSPSGWDRPRYHAPDGSVHALVDQGGGLWVPEDTLHARFRFYTSPGEHWAMELPDGSTWWFEQWTSPPASPNEWDFFDGPYVGPNEHKQFALTRIQDRYAPSRTLLEVQYRADLRWQIEWIQMGSRRIDFEWGTFQTQADGSEPARDWPVLTRITLPAAHSQSLVATFAREDRRIERSSFESGPPTGCNMSAAPSTVRVPYLTGITVDDQKHTFSYAPVGMGFRGDYLLSVVLPTGGRIGYEYGGDLLAEPCMRGAPGCWALVEEMDFPELNRPQEDPSCAFEAFQSFISANAAVERRTETDPVSPVTNSTEYRRKSVVEPTRPWPDSDEPDMGRVVRGVAVSRPDGDGGRYTTKHLFSVEVRGGPTGIELARRTYEGTNVGAGASPVRSVVSCYDSASLAGLTCGVTEAAAGPPATGLGIPEIGIFDPRRLRREVTWYGTNPLNGGVCSDTTASHVACWSVERDEWNAAAREFKHTTTRIPRSGPSLVLMQGGMWGRRTTTIWAPRESPRWLPKLFISRAAEDLYDSGAIPPAPASVTTTYTFDSNSGKLLSTAVAAGAASLTRQLDYGPQDGSDPVVERLIGGGNVTGAFATTRTFQNGQVLTARRTEPQGIGWNQFHVVRDPATDVVTTSVDPNGLATTYSWDPLGRLSGIQPVGEASTEICYFSWSASSPSTGVRVLVKRGLPAGCGPSALSLPTPAEGSGTAEAFVYDGFGRLTREIRLLPTWNSGSYMAVRVTTRNDAGLVSSVSEWTPCGSGSNLATCLFSGSTKLTTYSSFDVFGRPRSVVLPDLTEVRKGYDDWEFGAGGTHIPATDTRDSTWITRDGVTGHYEAVRKDILGRIIATAEPVLSGPPPKPPHPQTTLGEVTYSRHDVHDRTAEVRQSRSTGPQSSYEQVRRLTRNALGFLTSETQPETGTIQYGSFTALGNPQETWKDDGTHLVSEFDALGRLRTLSSNGQEYLRNGWDELLTPEGASRGWSRGKLTTSVGQNPYPSAGFDIGFYPGGEIADSYSYLGLGGRLSKKETTLSNGAASTVTSWTYNTLGLVEQERFPRLPHLAGQLVAETRYAAGLPVRVSAEGQDVVRDVRYDPAGGLARYTSGNGVQTIVEPDQSGMPRPRQIRTSNGIFDTGIFTYDGRGNILSMGSDAFTYDGNSRLLTARYGALTRGYAYDGWNNLVSKDGMSLGVDVITNRLTHFAGLPVSYDPRGNVTALSGETYSYDGLDRQVRHDSGTSHWSYLFDSAHERIVKAPPPGNHPQGDAILRRHIARVILQAEGDVPLDTPSTFSDVPADDPERGWIERFRQRGYTNGCGANLFCPDNPTTRAEMAVFLASAMTPRGTVPDAGVTPAGEAYHCRSDGIPGTSLFTDVSYDHWACKFIHYIFKEGVTAGCEAPPNRRFCPTDLTTHWMMEVFASRLWPGFAHVPPGATYTFRGTGQNILTEYADSKVEKDYFYLGARLVGSRLVASNGTVSWNYHSTDHLGSVRYTMNAAGGTVQLRKFWPWGDEVGGGGPERLGFAGMEIDTEASRPRYYVHARNLETGVARFLAPDQLSGRPEDPLSWNRYTYARNNPLKYVDPDGKASTPAGWVVELTKAGLRKMQPLFSKRALTAARRREMNVLVNGTRQSAGEIERAAFGGAESAYRHSGHVLEDGVSHGLPHFQTADRWGHTFYGALGVVGLVLSPFDSAEAASVDDTMIPTGAEDPRFTPYVWPDGSRKPAAPEEEEEKEGNPDGQPKNRKVPGDCGPTKPCETGR